MDRPIPRFPDSAEESADRAAGLAVAHLRAHGVRNPGEECGLRDEACGNGKTLTRYGSGVGR